MAILQGIEQPLGTVLGHDFKLPGVGSYMATAVRQGDTRAVLWAILTMVVMVVLVDQLFWRPIVAWSQRLKFEETEAGQEARSWVLEVLRSSAVVRWMTDRVLAPRQKRWMPRSCASAGRRKAILCRAGCGEPYRRC